MTPVLQFAHKNFVPRPGTRSATAIGANYWWAGQNANIKALYTRIAPRGLESQNEFTVQFQIFYF